MPLRTVKIPVGAASSALSRVGPPAYEGADYLFVQGTNFDWPEWRFDPDTNETIFIKVQVPAFYLGGGHKLRLRWKSLSTGGSVRWNAGVQLKRAGATWDDTFTAAGAVNTAAPGTIGDIVETIIDLPSTSMIAGDAVVMGITRIADNAADTHTDDAILVDIDWLVNAPGPQYLTANYATIPAQNISNLATGAPNTVDGQALAVGDIILVWQQTTQTENGIYQVDVVGTGANGQWSRSAIMDEDEEVNPGVQVYIAEGDLMGRVSLTLVSTGNLSIGVDDLEFISGRPLVRSDTSAVVDISGATFTASQATAVKSSWLNVNDFDDIDVFIDVLSVGSIGEVTVFMEIWPNISAPGANGAVLQSDDTISLGAADLGDYLPKKPTAATGRYHWNFPSRGAQVRFGVFADVAADTFNLSYKRNVRS